MSLPLSGRTWEEASAEDAERLARQFESAWRRAPSTRRPGPTEFLPPNATPGSRLALLRTELALRFEAGEPIRAESYLERFPDLGEETLVALVYEEFCLREESGSAPDPADYYRRFPLLEAPLRRVLDIHGLVGSGRTASFTTGCPHAAPFPEAGQTIGGFRLVEELGRGSFARVFRAEERQLADRPVALKVSRAGSREPQTLARLQHTHIVPVYSYRTDPATELHLLCMPYLGGITLAQLLADPGARATTTGAGLLAALDRLGPTHQVNPALGAAGRLALQARDRVPAIAWWGARLAEALEHAHERGVLHRDVKPSNVLVTGDGLPMLLDFNLAWESRIDDPELEAATLGGTLAYMAPEHLEALAQGHGHAITPRCDLYALGVVLYEAMGSRPFPPVKGATSIPDLLRRTAEQRLNGPPPLRDRHSEVPAEFAAVVHRCLAPSPSDRYASAAELAADLQAVADDGPLVHAREPLASRAVRWTRRNRVRIALVVPVLLIAVGLVVFFEANRRGRERFLAEVREQVKEGMLLAQQERLEEAAARFEVARLMLSGGKANPSQKPRLEDQMRVSVRLAGDPDDLRALVRDQSWLTREKLLVRRQADTLRTRSEELRLRLLGFLGPVGDPSHEVAQALAPFSVLTARTWPVGDQMALLNPARRDQLRDDVEDLLFLWVIALDRRLGQGPHLDTSPPLEEEEATATRALALVCCDRALAFVPAAAAGPWRALKSRLSAHRPGQDLDGASTTDDSVEESSARACFQWGVLRALEGRGRSAVAWLERATHLRQNQYWYHYFLALMYQQLAAGAERKQGDDRGRALAHYDVAIALRESWPWPRFNRARLYQEVGAWTEALRDLETARHLAAPHDLPPIQLNLGVVRQALGDLEGARADYDAVLATTSAESALGRAARLNRARVDVETGAVARALEGYDALLATRPDDEAARLSRALVRLRLGQARPALADLDRLIANGPARADWLSYRAQARLVLGDASGADQDAEAALRLESTPARERLRARTLLALGKPELLRLTDAEELTHWPVGGAALRGDIQAAAESLDAETGATDLATTMTHVVLLAALGRHERALAIADAAVARFPHATRPRLVRARLRRGVGDLTGALADIEAGLVLEPKGPRFLILRGQLRTGTGHPESGLADLEEALRNGADRTVHSSRARALAALGREEQALDAWSRAIALDPERPEFYLGRARVSIRLNRWDAALADLEQAESWSSPEKKMRLAIAASYALCLPARPDRIGRALHCLARVLGP